MKLLTWRKYDGQWKLKGPTQLTTNWSNCYGLTFIQGCIKLHPPGGGDRIKLLGKKGREREEDGRGKR